MYEIEKEDFNKIAAALAHEVKNPVALIKANIELMENSFQKQAYENNIDIIKKQLDKINYLISDFIQLLKPPSNSDYEKIFIYDLINDITEDYDISLKGKKIEFEINSADEDISFFGNYTKLSILFFNIYKNSAEAIKSSGKITTEISKDTNYITIKIKDTGEGLKEEMKDKIFKPFVTTKKDGSGLGLSICKSIVDEYGASFDIKNRAEGGCEVTLKFKENP